MKKWLWLALLGCSVAQADMLDALKSYENKHYAEAQQQFAELLPLGNELAAFNLGAMAYQGEGQPANLTQALAYFMLAAELRYEKAAELLPALVKQATEQQLEQANQQLEQLKRVVAIKPTALDKSLDADSPEPIERTYPKYPRSAALNGQFGYVKLRFLVNEQGSVTAIDTLDTYPEKVFEASAVKAVKQWRYAASGKKHIMNIRLDYSLDGGVRLSEVQRIMNKHKLWDYAAAGAPQYQFTLGTVLALIAVQSPNHFVFDPKLPLAVQPDFSIFDKRAALRAELDGFWGYATVRVAKDGTITEQIKTRFEDNAELTNLVGRKLKGKVEAETYALARLSADGATKVRVTPEIRVSRAMSGLFWWEQAAKNGSADAQRLMAAYDAQWEDYLLQQQHAEVMAWTGTRMIIDGQREQGMQLLEQAIAKNYAPATEMKQQFM
ncbi:TonB family protein [Rheinheimera maricola]|uniref:TonB family protein n=1 Tax=Rheinheimera maricola TaxID=2793282 RepID=A0ABS7XDX4_9GAMM|nr:TonB family protein [Rheinheimera maricola]MBZ9613781.1 TonB family protein [Rheinheimera maricola]